MPRGRSLAAALTILLAVVVEAEEQHSVTIDQQLWGQTLAGQPVTRFTLTNAAGHSVGLTDWGATLLEVRVPDRQGTLANVNWSFAELPPYLAGHPHFGGTIGRFANRIAEGRFEIDGQTYNLAINNGPNHLHGGKVSYDHRLWQAETFLDGESARVRFSLHDPDGYENYPGNVQVTTEYTWSPDSVLTIRFIATTDAPTHINLTNHSYWNLAGIGSGSIHDHVAKIEADHFLDVDADLIPTGQFNEVAGSPLDFRQPTALGQRIDQLSETGGYDHCYVVRGSAGSLRPAATVIDPQSGRQLTIETTQPGMQLYTGNHLPGDASSAGAGKHDAFCLETQHYPDAPNRPEFPSTRLNPGQKLEQTTRHRFSVAE